VCASVDTKLGVKWQACVSFTLHQGWRQMIAPVRSSVVLLLLILPAGHSLIIKETQAFRRNFFCQKRSRNGRGRVVQSFWRRTVHVQVGQP